VMVGAVASLTASSQSRVGELPAALYALTWRVRSPSSRSVQSTTA